LKISLLWAFTFAVKSRKISGKKVKKGARQITEKLGARGKIRCRKIGARQIYRSTYFNVNCQKNTLKT
jgi:hypothetical protein